MDAAVAVFLSHRRVPGRRGRSASGRRGGRACPNPLSGWRLAACAGILLGEGGAGWFGHAAPGVWPAGPWIACGVFFAGALVFFRARRRVICWALVVCGFAALHLFRLNDPASVGLAAELAAPPASTPSGSDASTRRGRRRRRHMGGEMLRARGVILDEPRSYKPTVGSAREVSGPTWRFTVGLSSLALRGREWDCHAKVAVLWRNGSANLAMGEEVELAGRGGGIAVPRNPGEFDMESFRRRHGVRTEIRCSGAADVRRIAPAGWARAAAALPGLAQRFERWTQDGSRSGWRTIPRRQGDLDAAAGLAQRPGTGRAGTGLPADGDAALLRHRRTQARVALCAAGARADVLGPRPPLGSDARAAAARFLRAGDRPQTREHAGGARGADVGGRRMDRPAFADAQ